MNRRAFDWSLFFTLLAVGVLCRVMFRGIPNFMPVAAISLFAGYAFRSRILAVALPVAIMCGSDYFIGAYQWQMMAVVYLTLALPLVFRGILRQRCRLGTDETWASALGSVGTLMTCSLISSVVFFLATNFAWWPWSSMYEKNVAGLVQCYAAGLPFFRYTLAGDLMFAAVLFGGYAFALRAGYVTDEAAEFAKA